MKLHFVASINSVYCLEICLRTLLWYRFNWNIFVFSLTFWTLDLDFICFSSLAGPCVYRSRHQVHPNGSLSNVSLTKTFKLHTAFSASAKNVYICWVCLKRHSSFSPPQWEQTVLYLYVFITDLCAASGGENKVHPTGMLTARLSCTQI